jgi:hypothetical protein
LPTSFCPQHISFTGAPFSQPTALDLDAIVIDERENGFVHVPVLLGVQVAAAIEAEHDLTLATDRLDLLAALLKAMRQGHESAMQALGLRTPIQRVFLTGCGAEVVRKLIPKLRLALV